MAICCNGAIIYDLDNEQVVQQMLLQPEQLAKLSDDLRSALPGVYFAVENGERVTCEAAYLTAFPLMARWKPRVAEIAACYDEPIIKLMVLHPDYTLEDLNDRITSLIGKAYNVTHSGFPYLEISLAMVHKAQTLALLCQQRGVAAHEVVAFGDMPNDLSMLQWAGRGIAVSNAHPLVLEAADEITLSNSEDGVAVVLRRLLLNQVA